MSRQLALQDLHYNKSCPNTACQHNGPTKPRPAQHGLLTSLPLVFTLTPDHADHALLHFNSHVLPQLKHSLSLALLHYLPLAGKLTWPPHVHIPTISNAPDDTVSLLVAESSADFNRLSGDYIRKSSESRHLIPELLSYDDRASCMALQIALFSNQGLCIGVSMRHAVLDSISAIAFMKSWAYLCTRLGKRQYPSLLPELTPFFDRTVIKDPVGLCSLYSKNWLDFMGNQRNLKVLEDFGVDRNSVRATFKLNVEDIKKFEEKISSSQPLHLSTFVVTCAYVLVCLVKAREGERKRVATVAVKISNIIREIDGKGLFEGAEETLDKLKNWEEGEERISMGGSNKFTFCEVDYGWGRPKKVEIISIDRTGAFALSRGGDGNSIEIGMVLSKHEMEIFKSLFVSGLQDL
ncbi:malonyl-CoA:anthocyanidin 5-O-glucoside-6''-O-malonyltransferase-like [Mangifera indica]|uniref:malonyl-CoA:anthocyanidin 5-O-glucoside-6''-O-malonyltransferase-like n=1 Tax=Mangifera indica TaxID=29780 RepID=UPI001CFA5A5B|nr:malonyl-CoA:anthocyanidin 5-O-glucoside-6''-O-malonyltransferase-like [Mangifera indica]